MVYVVLSKESTRQPTCQHLAAPEVVHQSVCQVSPGSRHTQLLTESVSRCLDFAYFLKLLDFRVTLLLLTLISNETMDNVVVKG